MFSSVNSHSGALGIARRTPDEAKDFQTELTAIFGDKPAGGPEDPYILAERIDHGRIPSMRIDCGVGDFLIKDNREFHKHLESLHIPHEYEEFPGEHNWAYWDAHVREAIAFHARNLGIRKV